MGAVWPLFFGEIMSKILRMSDRIKIKVKDITFTIAPLSQLNKMEMTSSIDTVVGGNQEYSLAKARRVLMKYGLKGLEGVTDYNGKPYELEFDHNGDLTEECLSEVWGLEESNIYLHAAWQCLQEVPDQILDPLTDKPLEGVSLDLVTQEIKSG
jgi:hypothetical protein